MFFNYRCYSSQSTTKPYEISIYFESLYVENNSPNKCLQLDAYFQRFESLKFQNANGTASTKESSIIQKHYNANYLTFAN